jgi:hypothetical protein
MSYYGGEYYHPPSIPIVCPDPPAQDVMTVASYWSGINKLLDERKVLMGIEKDEEIIEAIKKVDENLIALYNRRLEVLRK